MQNKQLISTVNSKVIKASKETVYRAFTNPESLAVWMAPGDMTDKIYSFDLKVGGGFQMSLFYPESEKNPAAKHQEKKIDLPHDPHWYKKWIAVW